MRIRWTRTPKSTRGNSLLTLLGVLAFLGSLAFAVHALGAPAEPAPSITTQPANPTNKTSASFGFTDKDSRATFQCSLDGPAFSACTSPNSYSGLSNGQHTFRVRAKSGTGVTSAPASYTWVIDTQPPTTTITFPSNGGSYNATGWSAASCSAGATICGGATDPSGVASVAISIRQGNGSYWGGASFNQVNEFFNAVQGTASWRYALALPPDGSYTIHVKATDSLGNVTPAGSYTTSKFTILTAPPPAPTITQSPPNPTSSTDASFSFTDTQAGVRYRCQFDNSGFNACSSPKAYSGLAAGQHTFSVAAVDVAGNVSAPTPYAWTITAGNNKSFSISGNPNGSLSPGVTRSIPLVLSNPNNATIYVTALIVSVSTSPSGCSSAANISLGQSNVSTTAPVQIPGRGSVTLPSGGVSAPTIKLLNLATNQDACKRGAFGLSYAGSAHS